MAFWRLRQKLTDARLLGIRLASSDTTISGDYLKTGQTTTYSNYPVYYCADKGMYLFVGYSDDEISWNMGNFWALNSTVIQNIGVTDYDAQVFTLSCYAKHPTSDDMSQDPDTMEISTDYKTPTGAFLTASWEKPDGSTVAITATDIMQPPLPLLDREGVDEAGVPRRERVMRRVFDDVLCYQRVEFNSGSFDTPLAAYNVWLSHSGPTGTRLATSQLSVTEGGTYPDGSSVNYTLNRWQGQIYIPTDGQYSLSVNHDDDAVVRIGDAYVGGTGNTTSTKTVQLTSGWNEIDMFHQDGTGGWRMLPTLNNQALDGFRIRCQAVLLESASNDYTYS